MKAPMSRLMSAEEFLATQEQLAMFASLVLDVDVDGYLQAARALPSVQRSNRLDAFVALAEGVSRCKVAAVEFRNTMTRLRAFEER